MADAGYNVDSSSGGGGGDCCHNLHLDGLLEGHESRCHVLLYKFWMFCYLTFGVFGVVSSFATMKQPRFSYSSFIISGAILGFIAFSLFLIKNYRVMNMDPVWRKAAYFVMFMNVLLCAAQSVLMHESFQELPGDCPEPPTSTTTTSTTAVPGASTTTPPATTTNSSFHLFH